MADENTPVTAPPPPYQAYPQPGMGGPPAGAAPAYPQEPPPKYEPPMGKEGMGEAPYPQQAPGPYPGYQSTTTTTSTVYPGQVPGQVIIAMPGYNQDPRMIQCPGCQAQVTTSLNYKDGGMVWLSAGLICLFGCWLGCCLIPFCIDDLKDVEHRCPNCHVHLGTYSRL